MAMEAILSFCRMLVQARGASGEEGPAAETLLEELRRLGFQSVQRDQWGNVIARVGPDARPRLLFAAHMDTVPADSREWSIDPFSGTEKDGRVYGRGASDMKGALAAMVHAGGAMRGESLRGSVWITGTICEEIFEGAGLGKVVDSIQPDFVVIGESSDLAVNRGQRGRAEVILETRGVSAHSAHPEAGRNALKAMAPLLAEIEVIQLPHSDFLGPAILEPTDIISEPYPGLSVLPSRCRVTLDRRLLVGETEEDVLSPIRKAIEHVARSRPGVEARVGIAEDTVKTYTGRELTHRKFAPAWEISEDHPLVRAGCRALETCCQPVRIGHYDFCTDGSYSAGAVGIPTIGLGPSQEDRAHVRDEYIQISELSDAFEVYQALIRVLLS